MRGRELKCEICRIAPRRRVRPHARAGVEICPCGSRMTSSRFALTRGRELNVPMASSITSCCSSPLTRRRRGARVCGDGGRLFVAGCGCASLGVFAFWGVLFSRCCCFCRSCCLYFGRRQGDVGGLLVWGLSLARGRMGRSLGYGGAWVRSFRGRRRCSLLPASFRRWRCNRRKAVLPRRWRASPRRQERSRRGWGRG